jgi:sugar/nucleoside kinase (ribokinase family)
MRPLCGLYALTAVDGTAAGDAFCAALVVSLLQGRERGEAPSLPTAAELEEILAR